MVDVQKRQKYIAKMLRPDITVNSLIMFANGLYKTDGQEGLRDFLAALCRMDIYKAVMMTQRLDKARRTVAEEYVYQILAERCQSEDAFSYVELLALAARQDIALLQTASPFMTEEIVQQAMQNADALTACSLLQMSLDALTQESSAWVQQAFCRRLYSQYDERIELALPELMPRLLEHDAVHVLFALVKVVSPERLSQLGSPEMFHELNRLILSGKDSVGIWELFFHFFFQQEHTPEELLDKGLWYIQLFAGDDIYDHVCTSFSLHVLTRYGADDPVLAHISDFSFPIENNGQLVLRFKDAIRPLWEDPHALVPFLNAIGPCNPFRKLQVQSSHYRLLQTAQDRTAYGRLRSLFEAGLSVDDIVNVFFFTDLKQRLPLEDLFYLAQRYEALPGLLASLQNRLFNGTVANQEARWLYVSPYAYFTTGLHTVPITHEILEHLENRNQLKGQEVQYTITAFVEGRIRIGIRVAAQLPEANTEDAVTWEAAILQLRQQDLRQLTEKQLRKLAVTEFSLTDVIQENGINLLTELIMDQADCLDAFLELLRLCKWNASFLKPELELPKGFFHIGYLYQQKAEMLFRFLLTTRENTEAVLRLYFCSIYRAIVPLNQFLMLAPKEQLMEHLPDFQVCCRLSKDDSSRCRPDNIGCTTICTIEDADGVSRTKPFNAVIADFTMVDGFVSEILFRQYKMGAADVLERGALFGYLARSIQISSSKAQRIATMPSAADYDPRELAFNMHRMEEAIFLRRSNAAELSCLIQTLGDANPYAFGVSSAVEWKYLRRGNSRVYKLDCTVSMVLNARSIEDIRNFYLHTHIKFHLQLPQLAALIRERRADLVDQIPKLFDGVTFQAIADHQGRLWMPWVAQNTLQVLRSYAGMVLSCRMRMEKDGAILVDVTQAAQSELFFDILTTCLLAGYRTDPGMEELVERLEEAALPESGTLTYSEYFERLRRMPYSKQFSHEKFAQKIQQMLLQYSDQPSDRIKRSVLILTSVWLPLHPDKEQILPLLLEICRSFVQQYQDTRLCNAVSTLLAQHLGKETAETFMLQLQGDAPTVKEIEGMINHKQPFTSICEKLRQMHTGTFFLTRRTFLVLRALIKAYHDLVPAEEMETAVSALTAQWLQRAKADKAVLNELLNIHAVFVKFYQSDALGATLCRQSYQYLPQDDAQELKRKIDMTAYRAPKDRQEQEPTLQLFEERVAQLQRYLQDPQRSHIYDAKPISKLIRQYRLIISAAQMEQAILALTAQWMQTLSLDNAQIKDLLDIHTAFIEVYQSGALGLALCRQAYQYTSESTADRLDRGIFKITFTHFEYHPDLEQMLLPFEQRIILLQNWLQNSRYSNNDIKGRITRLIRHYGHIISEEKMEQAVSDLLGPRMARFVADPHAGQFVREVHLAFESCYGTSKVGISLLRLTCRQLERDLDSAAQLSQPVPARTFTAWIEKMIRHYKQYTSAEDMKSAVLALTERWVLNASEKAEMAQSLHDIQKHFHSAYASADIGCDLYRLGCQHLGRPESDDLLRLTCFFTPSMGATLAPLHIRQEQLSLYLAETVLQEKKFVNKLHTMVKKYAKTASVEEIAQTIVELAEQWIPRGPDEEQLRYYLYGIHDCYIKYCRSDYLAGLLCRFIEKHQGADAANAFAERLQVPLQRLQSTDTTTPDNTERI